MNISASWEIFNSVYEKFCKELERVLDKEDKQIALVDVLVNLVTRIVFELGRMLLAFLFEELDRSIKETRDRKVYRHRGNYQRNIKTKAGCVEFKRARYETVVEGKKEYVYLLDDQLGLTKDVTIVGDLREEILNDVCQTTYRNTSRQIGETTGTHLSHQSIWKFTQKAGITANQKAAMLVSLDKAGESRGKISTPILYTESDGIWLSLQGKSRKQYGKSKELKVSIAYDGVIKKESKKGKIRRTIDEKVAYASFSKSSDFSELVRAMIADKYDIDSIEMVIKNGDGAEWIKNSEIPESENVMVLDKFHRNRKLRECVNEAEDINRILKLLNDNKVSEVLDYIDDLIYNTEAVPENKSRLEKLEELRSYYLGNTDNLVDPYSRNIDIPPTRDPGKIHHARLGSMESNVYTLIGNRMKGNRCCWSIDGANNLSVLLCKYHTDGFGDLIKHIDPPTSDFTDNMKPLSAHKACLSVGKGYEYPYHSEISTHEKWLKDLVSIKGYTM